MSIALLIQSGIRLWLSRESFVADDLATASVIFENKAKIVAEGQELLASLADRFGGEVFLWRTSPVPFTGNALHRRRLFELGVPGVVLVESGLRQDTLTPFSLYRVSGNLSSAHFDAFTDPRAMLVITDLSSVRLLVELEQYERLGTIEVATLLRRTRGLRFIRGHDDLEAPPLFQLFARRSEVREISRSVERSECQMPVSFAASEEHLREGWLSSAATDADSA